MYDVALPPVSRQPPNVRLFPPSRSDHRRGCGRQINGIESLIELSRQQRTIAQPARIQGISYWSGQLTTVEFRPAEPDTGLVFVRNDLVGEPRIPASTECRMESARRTTLSNKGVTVEMVEHVLAALAGLQIDNCEIVVDAREMPANDGSSQAAVEAICDAGVVTQHELREVHTLDESIRVGSGDLWIEARPTSDTGLRISYELDYPFSSIGHQYFELAINPDSFHSQLASARTFLMEHKARAMQSQGVGRGLSFRDLLVFGEEGPLENELRFPNECVRHKVLDIVGDLALIGFDLNAEIVAHKSGHRLNTELAAMLRARHGSHRSVRLLA